MAQAREAGAQLPAADFASKAHGILCVASNWSDATFLEELGASNLLSQVQLAHAALKATTDDSRPTRNTETTCLEEMAKCVHQELSQVERRLPGSSLLGPRTAYSSWAAVGHALYLMVQALHDSTTLPPVSSEAMVTKLLTNKQVLAHSGEVLRGINDSQRQAVCLMLFKHLTKGLQATKGVLDHISLILAGDEATSSPVPSSLPKSWYVLSDIFTAYKDLLRPTLAPGAPTQLPTAADAPLGVADHMSAAEGQPGPSAASEPHEAKQARDAPGTASPGASPDTAMGESATTETAAVDSSAGAAEVSVPGAVAALDNGAVPQAPLDPISQALNLAVEVVSSLVKAVIRSHGLGRTILLLRAEATAKHTSAAAFMPTALNANDVIAHLDCLATLAVAMQSTGRLKDSLLQLLTAPALKDLLGTGKIYVATVIAVGALSRDLGLATVVPKGLRQGYMQAVMPPLETGALLNERRVPQVLAYRNNVTESSYYQVMDAEALPHGVNVRYEDEVEAEGQGVVREWLSGIAADLFKQERGLFVRGQEDRRVVHPSPLSGLQDDHLGYIRFAGRIVGLALRANVPLGITLSSGLFKVLTGRSASLEDLKEVDSQVYTTCQNILSTEGVEAMDLYHVWHHASLGDTELVPCGAQLRVTDANKAAYVELVANHLLKDSVKDQVQVFFLGLQDTAPHLPDNPIHRAAWLSPLCLNDINRITAGESSLDVDDWCEHTDFVGFDSHEEAACIGLFWDMVSNYSQEERQRLLQFWTAMTHLPSGGFKALNQHLQVMKLAAPPRPAAPDGQQQQQRRLEEQGEGVQTPAAGAAAGPPAPDSAAQGPRSHELPHDAMEEDEDADQAGAGQATGGAGPGGGSALSADAAAGASGTAQAGAPADGSGGTGSVPAAGAAQPEPAAAAAPGADHPGQSAPPEIGTADPATTVAAAPGGGAEQHQQPHPAAEEAANGDDAAHVAAGTGNAPVDPPAIMVGEDEGDMDGYMDDYHDDEEGAYGEEDDEEEYQRQLALALQLSLQADVGGPGVGPAAGADEGAGAAAEQQAPAVAEQQEAQEGEQPQEQVRQQQQGDAQAQGEVAAGGFMAQDGGTAPAPDAAAGGASGSGGAAAAPALGTTSGGNSEQPAAVAGTNGAAPHTPNPTGNTSTGGTATEGSPVGAADTPSLADSGPPSPSSDADMDDMAAEDSNGRLAPEGPADGPLSEGAAAPDAAEHTEPATSILAPPPTAQGAASAAHAASEQLAEGTGRGASAAADSSRMDMDVDGEVVGSEAEVQAPGGAQGTGAGVMEVEDGGSLGPVGTAEATPQPTQLPAAAASTPGPSAGKAPSLLPQARTCFLQLNLPVYTSLEEMKQAFAIALDNMAFGMQ